MTNSTIRKSKSILKYRPGVKVNYLTILEIIGRGSYKKAICKCDCGKVKEFWLANIQPRKGKTRYTVSCGCMHSKINTEKNSTHRMSKDKFYKRWRSMFDRTSPIYICAESYEGVSVSETWSLFDNFYADMYESYLIHREKFGERETTLDRIDPKGNYCKENCRWATQREQSLNRKNTVKVVYNGEKVPLLILCERLDKHYDSVYHKILNGKSLEMALETCKRGYVRKGSSTWTN